MEKIMQKAVYVCDNCEKEIGRKKHLSLTISPNGSTGVAIPPGKGDEPIWTVAAFSRKFVHFCSGNCAGVWFGAELKKKKLNGSPF